MPGVRAPLLGLRASGLIGGHRHGPRRRTFANPTAQFSPTVDALFDALFPNDNYGQGVGLMAQVSYLLEEKVMWRRFVMTFPLSGLSGKTPLSAHLLLYAMVLQNAPMDLYVSRNIRPATTTEDGVTWNCYDHPNPWTQAGGDFDDDTPPKLTYLVPDLSKWHTIPGLLAHVQDALANRDSLVALHFRLADEAPEVTTGASFNSQENLFFRPLLVVEYA